MSKFVKVQTQLRDVSMIKRALDDLQVEYQEDEQYRHRWSGFSGRVPFVINTERITFGLREGNEGAYEVIGDDMQMGRIRPLLAKLQQRYAYHKVVAETEKAGFALVEEAVGNDNVIRMTVRRWS